MHKTIDFLVVAVRYPHKLIIYCPHIKFILSNFTKKSCFSVRPPPGRDKFCQKYYYDSSPCCCCKKILHVQADEKNQILGGPFRCLDFGFCLRLIFVTFLAIHQFFRLLLMIITAKKWIQQKERKCEI